MGHLLGNHTYDHVDVLATSRDQLQHRFRRAPWLLRSMTPAQAIADNVRLTAAAMKERLGVAPCGFRTPHGFPEGLKGRVDVQQMLLGAGYRWVSSQYPQHLIGHAGDVPSAAIYDGVAEAARRAQPFAYPETALLEIPMSPISDVVAFRNGRWELEHFLRAIRRVMESTIESGGVFDFLGHPSCLHVTDPKMQAVDLICEMVEQSRGRAAFATLGDIARELMP